ncbi:hypothetical protein D3C86_1567500 [compost metagenome]
MDGHGLRKGNNRIAFAPDGSLYIGQNSHGWLGDEGIQRIIFTGRTPVDVYTMSLTSTGFDLTFTQPIDRNTAMNKSNYKMRHYYYEYHKKYGSDQFGLESDLIKNITVSADGKKVSLTIDALKAGYVYELGLDNIKSQKGEPLDNKLVCYTLNKLRK